MFLNLLTLSLLSGLATAASNSSTVVCVAGQCLQGYTNTTIGTTLSAPGAATSLLLLPGEYTSTTSPQLLHTLLTTSTSTLSPSPGFSNSSSSSSVSLPLSVALQPGLAIYPQSLYSGGGSFASLPTTPATNASQSTPITAASLAISPNVWVAVTAGSSSSRLVLWNSVPDVAQLPAGASGALGLLDMQSSACSPACAGAGVCSAAGTCTCPAGFSGASCEACAAGFFGPACEACPAGCTQCDDGIGGSGRCLAPTFANAPATCNCLNGVCDGSGGCTCNAGWTAAANGTACAQCASGFFLTANGDCSICQLGCTDCADQTGTCITCKQGFTQNANDKTQCLAVQGTSSGGTTCPDGSFSNSGTCQACSPLCKTCSAGTSNDCIICGNGEYSFNGSCVGTDGNGVCEGSKLIADNNKHECDSCPAKCTSCKIPNFNVASTVDQLQCDACIPGFVLSGGKCIASCPTGTFLSPSDNMTCTACDSSCGTCAGSATFCLTCANSQLAASGKCVASCPSNTFSAAGACLPCHPDCATCSGGSFNQCSSCAADRPVLTNGRCLPTCAQNQFFDTASSTCQACDASCASCSAAGASSCLACAGAGQVLRAGACTAAACTGNSTVVPGLGVCLSDLVSVPAPGKTTGSAPPLPSVSGIDAPAVVSAGGGDRLSWWEILLMALGCAFIFLVVVLCWRRRARARRAQRTAQFANAKALDKRSWSERFFGLFRRYRGGARVRLVPISVSGPVLQTGTGAAAAESEEIKLMRMRNAEEARHHQEMEKLQLFGAYEYSRAGSARGPSPLPSLYEEGAANARKPTPRRAERDSRATTDSDAALSVTQDSLYSQVTGVPRRAPAPRQPVKTADLLGLESRFSTSSLGSSVYHTRTREIRSATPAPPTAAEAYAHAVTAERLEPSPTGGSGGSSSRNPFRR